MTADGQGLSGYRRAAGLHSGQRDKVIREDGELIPGEALTRMRGLPCD